MKTIEASFWNVEVEDEEGQKNDHYVALETILNDKELASQVLKEAMEYLRWFREKYSSLKELMTVHKAIDFLLR